MEGTITRLFSDFADVALDAAPREAARTVTARLRGRLTLAKGEAKAALAVGDRVRVAGADDETVIETVLPRRTWLSRRDPRNPHREQVIAANVDRVLVVASAKLPPLRPRLIDRYLVAASVSGLEAAVCLTKCDLVEEGAARAATATWSEVGIAVHRVGLGDRTAIEHLRQEWLAGHATVLVGQSGVGKSTLRNALLPPAGRVAETAPVSERTGKGRHRTTAATFEPLPPSGFLVDTPGAREFGLFRLRPEDVASHFPEFAAAQRDCRFRDCRHAAEPGCALRALVESGRASGARLTSLRLLAESLGG